MSIRFYSLVVCFFIITSCNNTSKSDKKNSSVLVVANDTLNNKNKYYYLDTVALTGSIENISWTKPGEDEIFFHGHLLKLDSVISVVNKEKDNNYYNDEFNVKQIQVKLDEKQIEKFNRDYINKKVKVRGVLMHEETMHEIRPIVMFQVIDLKEYR